MKLRFTIRDLFWLTLVVGLAVGWWFDARDARKWERDLRNTVQLVPVKELDFTDPRITANTAVKLGKNADIGTLTIIRQPAAKP